VQFGLLVTPQSAIMMLFDAYDLLLLFRISWWHIWQHIWWFVWWPKWRTKETTESRKCRSSTKVCWLCLLL